jgi:proline iminopeptidase
MHVSVNDNELNVEVLGPEGAPVLIAHHGGGGIGWLAELKATFGPLADKFRVIVLRRPRLWPERRQATLLP